MSDHENRSATLRDLIRFYETHGRMPFPIQGGETDPANPDPKTDDFPDGVGDAGKEAIRKERDARKEADRKASEASKELANLRKEKADRDDAEAKAKEETARKNGEFEKLAADRAADLDTLKAESQARADKLERANAALASVLAERIKALEATGDKDLIAAFPKDAEPLDQLDWLNDPRTKAALAKAAETEQVEKAKANPRNPITPRPNGTGKEITSPISASRIAG